MRIVFLTNFIPPYRKTLYEQITLKVRVLKIFISIPMESNRNWKVNHDGLAVIIQKNWSYVKNWRFGTDFIEQTTIHIPYDTITQLKQHDPDVVISGELGFRSLLAAIYCKKFKKPLILWITLSEHTETNKKGIRIVLRKYLLKSASALLCNGESGKRYVQSLGIEKPTFKVPYSSDYTIRNEAKKTFNPIKRILFTGQLIKRKGVLEMIESLEKWALENPTTKIELIVAGDGPEKVHFNLLENTKNVTVELLGTVPYEELKELYNKVDLYLFPTLADEWGVVVNEALSRGLPVIGSLYSQAVEELIQNEKNGWLFHPDQQKEFVKTLNKAINTPDSKLQKMSVKGIEAIQLFTPEKISENVIEAIKSVFKK